VLISFVSDLAVRNLLVNADSAVKISDFGIIVLLFLSDSVGCKSFNLSHSCCACCA